MSSTTIAPMGLHNIDITAAMRRLAERRIEEGMREGKFDNLEGAGKPLELEPAPADENARMTWWAIRILKQNDVIPDEVRWRKALDHLRARLDGVADEAHVARVVREINELVHKINTLGTNALKGPVAPVDLDTELARLRARVTRT